MKCPNIVPLKMKEILLRNGYSEEQLRCKPEPVLEALYQHTVIGLIDEVELEQVLNSLGYGLEGLDND